MEHIFSCGNFYIKGGLKDKAIDALRKAEQRLSDKDGIGYNHLISLYARLEDKDEVLRLWHLEKSSCKRCINRDYITMLESLVRIGALKEAEEVLKEWEASGNCFDFRVPNAIVIGYCEKGLVEKAEAILLDLKKGGRTPTPNSWGKVAEGYLNKGEMVKAKDCMKVALSLHVGSKGWKPNPKVVSGILSWLGDNGDIKDVEDFVGSCRRGVVTMDILMYHALLKANIRNGKEVDGILSSMKADKLGEDEETKEILGLRHIETD